MPEMGIDTEPRLQVKLALVHQCMSFRLAGHLGSAVCWPLYGSYSMMTHLQEFSMGIYLGALYPIGAVEGL